MAELIGALGVTKKVKKSVLTWGPLKTLNRLRKERGAVSGHISLSSNRSRRFDLELSMRRGGF